MLELVGPTLRPTVIATFESVLGLPRTVLSNAAQGGSAESNAAPDPDEV